MSGFKTPIDGDWPLDVPQLARDEIVSIDEKVQAIQAILADRGFGFEGILYYLGNHPEPGFIGFTGNEYAETRDYQAPFRLTVRERKALDERAGQIGRTPTETLRYLLMFVVARPYDDILRTPQPGPWQLDKRNKSIKVPLSFAERRLCERWLHLRAKKLPMFQGKSHRHFDPAGGLGYEPPGGWTPLRDAALSLLFNPEYAPHTDQDSGATVAAQREAADRTAQAIRSMREYISRELPVLEDLNPDEIETLSQEGKLTRANQPNETAPPA